MKKRMAGSIQGTGPPSVRRLSLDIETFSSVDLAKGGVYRYAESPDFQILLIGYSLCWPPTLDAEEGRCVLWNEQIQCEDDQVQLAIQDVSWAPEADIMTISFRATPKHSDQDELHSIWALDTDGSYIGEGGSVTITDDSEDRAMHWLWRPDIGLEGSGGYGHIPGYGPVSDMMDDSSMHLLLLDYTGTNIIINSDEVENAVEMFPMESSIDMFRTTAGDVYFVGKFDLSWLREEYDQEMQKRAEETSDMKEYYDQRISIAQAARERIGKEGITCILTYRVVEYTEGMNDMDLYTNGGGRSVQFIIRPKQ